MKIDFNIINSILFGNLRPALNLLSDTKYKLILQPSLNAIYSSFKEFEAAFLKIVDKNPLISTSEDYKLDIPELFPAGNANSFDIFEALLFIDLPPVFDKISAYYKFLIEHEAIRLSGSIHKALSHLNTSIDKKYYCGEFYERLHFYYDETENQLNDSIVSPKNNLKNYVLTILKTTLLRVIIETQELCSDLLRPPFLEFEELKNSNQFTDKPLLIIASNLYKFKIEQMIENKKYSKSNALQLVEKVKQDYISFINRKSENSAFIQLNENQLNNLQILENYIFLNEFNLYQPGIKIENLLDFDFENQNLELYKIQFLSNLEKMNHANLRMEFISKEILKLSRVFNTQAFTDKTFTSIPRQSINWLNTQYEFYATNLNKDISFFNTLKIKPVNEQKNKPAKEISKAFSYKKYSSNFTQISDLLTFLSDNGFVAKETDIKEFRKIFNNKLPENPIIWKGHISELYWFVKLLHREFQMIEDLDKEIWKITATLFVDEFFNPFDWTKFKGQKKPAKAELLRKAVKLLE